MGANHWRIKAIRDALAGLTPEERAMFMRTLEAQEWAAEVETSDIAVRALDEREARKTEEEGAWQTK